MTKVYLLYIVEESKWTLNSVYSSCEKAEEAIRLLTDFVSKHPMFAIRGEFEIVEQEVH